MRAGSFFASVLLAGASALALASPAAAEQELHVLHAGGQWGDAITKCVEEDMAKTMGIKVIPESPGGLAKLRGIVESGTITHTAFDMETSELVRARAMGLIQELDWAKINPEPIFPEAQLPDAPTPDLLDHDLQTRWFTWRTCPLAPTPGNAWCGRFSASKNGSSQPVAYSKRQASSTPSSAGMRWRHGSQQWTKGQPATPRK